MSEKAIIEPKGDIVHISDEVLAIIAGISCNDVKNVTSLSAGFVEGIAGILGRKHLGKGVKVQMNGNEVSVEISVIVEFGCTIHMVAKEIQEKVRKALEDMTGLIVSGVNINIIGVNFEKEVKKVEPE
jgi:uncharacterized alkaline shock family protein YloU